MCGSGHQWCAAADAVAHVFVDALADRCDVGSGDGHHLARVRRLRVGERVTAADGTGAWRPYAVVEVRAGGLLLEAAGSRFTEPALAPGVAVAVALLKGGLDAVVARLTELGVARIEPVRTARTVVRWDARRATNAVARLRAVAREAAMQSRRARLPEVADVADLATLTGRPDVVVATRTGGPAAAVPAPASGTWTVVVGPEGGFAPGELEALGSVATLAVGPHVLRAETAPVAAAAALLARSR